MRTTPNPMIIAWAIERVGKQPSDLASISKNIEQWISGEKVPTVKQMQKLAARTYVPLPYFYGDDIPSMPLQIPDYRTTYSGSAENPSPELYETINLMQARQDWTRAYLIDAEADTLSFVGKYANDKDVKRVAYEIRSILKLKDGWARTMQSDEAVRYVRDAMEAVGVYTCAGSYFHHNSRPYNVGEFRGFVLVDHIAPFIFLNTQDSRSAQLFTLIHEFAHILFDESGVDDLVYEDPDKEDLCDCVAAEVLVPESLVYAAFGQKGRTNKEAIGFLRRATKTSEIVCLRRARELKKLKDNEFFSLYNDYKRELAQARRDKRIKRGGGPSYYVVQKSMMGNLFSDVIYEGIKSERLMFSDAYRLTDMKAASFEKFYAEDGKYL